MSSENQPIYAYTSTDTYLKRFDTVEKWREFLSNPDNKGLDFVDENAMMEFYNAIYKKYGDVL